ncbi:MAG: CBS domain-containing protein [Thermoguttaceae bacterium]|jgi:diguanylate cyclase (GGDEF)-like protein
MIGASLWRRLTKVIRRRPRRPGGHVEFRIRSPEGDISDVQTRIYAKRQHLLLALSTERDLVTKNRIAARHLMTHELVVVSPQASVGQMRALMAKHRVHHLLVCEKGRRLVGVVSDRDLQTRRGKTAGQIMTPDPLTVAPDTPLSPAITCLVDRQISCLPVVEKSRLCGVITSVDVLLVSQCVLQLWLRLAGVMQDSPTWMENLANAVELVEHDLNHQQQRMEKIAQSLQRWPACGGNTPSNSLHAELEEILAVTRNLTGLIGKTRSEVEVQRGCMETALYSRTDPITGLNTRAAFEEMVENMLAVRNHYGHVFSLLIVAINRLPARDGELGAEIDPPLLRVIAGWIVHALRDSDLSSRYSANAFALLLPRTGLAGARIACHRLRRVLLENLRHTGRFSIRLGVVEALAGEPLPAFFARAETTMAECRSGHELCGCCADTGNGMPCDDAVPAGVS